MIRATTGVNVFFVLATVVVIGFAWAGLSDDPDPTSITPSEILEISRITGADWGLLNCQRVPGTGVACVIDPRAPWVTPPMGSSGGNACSSNENCKNSLNGLCGTKGAGCKTKEPVYTAVMLDRDRICHSDGCEGGNASCAASRPFVICRTPEETMHGGW